MTTYAEWSAEVQRIDAVTARGLPEEVVNRLRWVEIGANRKREDCVALLRDLNKPPIPLNVKKWFYMPLKWLSVHVRGLRSALLWAVLNELYTYFETYSAWICGFLSLKSAVRL